MKVIDISNMYWFYISPDVYVSFEDPCQVLLYNTNNGKHIIQKNDKCVQLVKDVYEPKNLGVIELTEEHKNNTDCKIFIEEIIENQSGGILLKENYPNKPINFLPILNLQDDVGKMIEKEEKIYIGLDVARYLAELNIFVINTCNQSCRLCNIYVKQYRSCFKSQEKSFLSIEDMKSILDQTKITALTRVNIMGGNILLHPDFDNLRKLLKHYPYNYVYWINYKNIEDAVFNIEENDILKILVDSPIDKTRLSKIIKKSTNSKQIDFIFFVEDESQLMEIEPFSEQIRLSIIPIFNGKNLDFFSSYVYLSEEDILDKTIPMRQIFCNQKLNVNYFGVLDIYSDGSIRSSFHSNPTMNIHNNNLLEAIYEELIENTAWRKTRKGVSCDICSFKYLCPPPTNYEIVIGKSNLCTVKKTCL